ncbi:MULTISPECIES: cation-translocating P-type ATPase [Oceanimonas]|uniref:heavy metal translocating P-type ATPase n=1 Tax=Oceanimonas TaxID=129577 RepID=UPI00293682D3|nr:cation-translocating P-type ATPase [Oceanimonas sp. CAM02]MDV2856706.1 cation-translocating P-type ATPase [Oceanimonas sp. CAM02]
MASHNSAASAATEQIVMIEGMHCGGCALALEQLLQRQPGVTQAAVNFAADIALIGWREQKPDFSLLKKVVSRLGYTLHEQPDPDLSRRQAAHQRKRLQWRLAVAVVFGMWSMMPALLVYLYPLGAIEANMRWPLALASGLFAIPVLLYSGAHFYRSGLLTLRAGQPGLDSLITLAVLASVTISVWQLQHGSAHVYFDVAVMLITFQLFARLIETNVRRRAAEVVGRYFQQMPDSVLPENSAERVPCDTLSPGDKICLTAGEQLALDGIVVQGTGLLDAAIITGEHEPESIEPGSELFAGSRLVEGEIILAITATAGQRRADRLAHTISTLLTRKSALQRLTDTIARWLLPVILLAALLGTMTVLLQQGSLQQALAHGLAVLVVTCPCALSLATPLVITLGHAQLLKSGIMLQDLPALEAAADIELVVFDKTGTLTTSTPQIAHLEPAQDETNASLLQLAADILYHSAHPVALGLRAALPEATAAPGGRHLSLAGQGSRWQSPNGEALAGKAHWLQSLGIKVPAQQPANGMGLHLARNGRYAGYIAFHEALRPGISTMLKQLVEQGRQVKILSGDTAAACHQVAARLGLNESQILAERSPEQKLRFIASCASHCKVAFVGDGLNDGPALAAAHLGIAVGNTSAATGGAADIYLSKGAAAVPFTLAWAQRARRLMRQNIGWALAYNLLIIPAAMAGWVQPVLAAVAMSLSSLCVLLNSLRIQ